MKRLLIAIGATAASIVPMALLLFVIAGRWDLPWFLAYLVVYAGFVLTSFLVLDPGLLKERFSRGAKGPDRTLLRIGDILAFAHYLVAALDVGRFGWSGKLPSLLQWSALALFVLCATGIMGAMLANRFYSLIIRIQYDRGHYVVTSGPYRMVRHPGYLMSAVMILSSALVLGSWWALIPSLAFVLIIIRRTALEDRVLQNSLAGYTQYAQHVPYRLIPGVW